MSEAHSEFIRQKCEETAPGLRTLGFTTEIRRFLGAWAFSSQARDFDGAYSRIDELRCLERNNRPALVAGAGSDLVIARLEREVSVLCDVVAKPGRHAEDRAWLFGEKIGL